MADEVVERYLEWRDGLVRRLADHYGATVPEAIVADMASTQSYEWRRSSLLAHILPDVLALADRHASAAGCAAEDPCPMCRDYRRLLGALLGFVEADERDRAATR
jgi:hypothetical protein